MGVSDYIIYYETNEEKNNINLCIEEYKINYSNIKNRFENLNKLIYLDYNDDNIDYNNLFKYNINIDGIDIEKLKIKDNYLAECLIDDYYHSNIKTNDNKYGIRVFFSQSSTQDFIDHLERYNIKHINDPEKIKYTYIEKYKNKYKYLNSEPFFNVY